MLSYENFSPGRVAIRGHALTCPRVSARPGQNQALVLEVPILARHVGWSSGSSPRTGDQLSGPPDVVARGMWVIHVSGLNTRQGGQLLIDARK